MELYLLKFPNELHSEVFEHYPYLTVSGFALFCFILWIFKATVRTWVHRLCTKYWPKPKNFAVADSGILSMTDKLSRFAPRYPNNLTH